MSIYLYIYGCRYRYILLCGIHVYRYGYGGLSVCVWSECVLVGRCVCVCRGVCMLVYGVYVGVYVGLCVCAPESFRWWDCSVFGVPNTDYAIHVLCWGVV